MIKKIGLKYFLFIVLIGTLLFLIHFSFYNNHNTIIELWKIYVFHVLVSLIILVCLLWVSKNAFDKVGFAFMTLSVLKMLATILFLLPVILKRDFDKIPDISNFFIPYFFFLFLEIFVSLKLLHLSNK